MYGIFGDVENEQTNMNNNNDNSEMDIFSNANSLMKQIQRTRDLPEVPYTDESAGEISESERQARSLADAIAEASERSTAPA